MKDPTIAAAEAEAEAGAVRDTLIGAQETGAAEAAVLPPKQKRRINRQKLQDNLWGWAFCAPLIVGTVLFIYIALIMALLLSFTTYNEIQGDVWAFLGRMFSGEDVYAGDPLRWYKFVFTWTERAYDDSPATMNVTGMLLFNTVFYLIGIPIGMVLSMFFAVCMSRDIKGGNVFRVLYYIPCVASTISIVYTFSNMFKISGVINQMLGTQIPWMFDSSQPAIVPHPGGDPFWGQGLISKCVIVIMAVWKGLGGTIILYIAGLSGVNAATKEAAEIDGANGWQIFWKVTMPDLYPVIFYNMVTAIIGGLQIYAEPELFFPTPTADGEFPVFATSGYVSLIWYWGVSGRAFMPGNIYSDGLGGARSWQSLGAAYGMLLAVIILVITLFQFWLDSRRKD